VNVETVANSFALAAFLDKVRRSFGGYEMVDPWQHGGFDHDLVLRVEPGTQLPRRLVGVATNCNLGEHTR